MFAPATLDTAGTAESVSLPVVGCTQITDLRIAHHACQDKRKNDNNTFHNSCDYL